jgi:hypothetical protein
MLSPEKYVGGHNIVGTNDQRGTGTVSTSHAPMDYYTHAYMPQHLMQQAASAQFNAAAYTAALYAPTSGRPTSSTPCAYQPQPSTAAVGGTYVNNGVTSPLRQLVEPTRLQAKREMSDSGSGRFCSLLLQITPGVSGRSFVNQVNAILNPYLRV